jgi:two-component system LytT family response regulator
MGIKAIIIDDEPLARSIVREYLKEFPQVDVVQECQDGFEGLKAFQVHQPDLLFLDIQMPKINGFEMLELLDKMPAIIFTTAFDEYAIKAFESHAVDYLLKPFSKERFEKAMRNYLQQGGAAATQQATAVMIHSTVPSPAQSQRVVVKTAGKIKIIPMDDILYLEAADDYVKIFTAEGSFLKNKTMAFFEQVLNGQHFVRTHRSYLVNVQQITRLEPYEKDGHLAILKSGGRIPVSKTGYAKLRLVLGL